jgi:TerB-like protein
MSRPEPEPELESSAEDPFAGLDVAHTTLAEKLLSRSDWQRAEFEMLATKAGLMPDGAMETINEWAYERLGDALIEDGAVIIVHLGLLRDDIEPAAAAN